MPFSFPAEGIKAINHPAECLLTNKHATNLNHSKFSGSTHFVGAILNADRLRRIIEKRKLASPFSIFQKGVVIIDSPGIGESDIMDEMVKQYLPQAFAFIYVVNTINAGGVQKDRVSIEIT